MHCFFRRRAVEHATNADVASSALSHFYPFSILGWPLEPLEILVYGALMKPTLNPKPYCISASRTVGFRGPAADSNAAKLTSGETKNGMNPKP